jgi:hypothetical protein
MKTLHDDVFDKNERITALEVYLPNLDALKPGDVLLTRNLYAKNPDEVAQSWAIRRGSPSNYSHAMICTVPPTFTEAVGGGVANISLTRCFAFNISNVRVLRYHDVAIANEAGSIALAFLGQEYSLRKAIGTKFPKLRIAADDHGTFCSGLVGAAFLNAGAIDFDSDSWQQMTPGHIERLGCFDDVTDSVFDLQRTPENAEALSALDGDRSASPADPQVQVLQDYWRELNPLFDELRRIEPRIPALASFFEQFDHVTSGLDILSRTPESERSLELVQALAQLRRIDDKMFEFLSCGQLESIYDAVLNEGRKELDRLEKESLKAVADINTLQLTQSITTTTEQLRRREASTDRLKEKPQGLSRSLDWWLHLQEQQLAYYRKALDTYRLVAKRLQLSPQ